MRSVILAASRNARIKRLVATAPISRSVVKRFVPGDGTEDAVDATRRLVADGLPVSLDHLGEDTHRPRAGGRRREGVPDRAGPAGRRGPDAGRRGAA